MNFHSKLGNIACFIGYIFFISSNIVIHFLAKYDIPTEEIKAVALTMIVIWVFSGITILLGWIYSFAGWLERKH